MASELKEHDFLKQSEEETLRQEARNILSSYSQVYDVLAESLQNAVDAVDERYSQEPTTATAKIAIEFDAPERSITVTDTGTGIPWDMLQNAPAPNITYKQGTGTARTRHQRSRGEKGVGLSFLTFACNLLRVTTCNGSETIEVEVHKANDWVQGRISERPKLTPTTSVPSPVSEKLDSQKYTQIQLIDLKTQDYCDRDIFDMSLRELLYTLRTKTAVGHTKAVILESTPEPEIEVSLSFVREDGEETTQRVPYKYLSPEEYLSERSILPYERFLELLKMDRLNTARGKALVYRNQQTTPGGRSINCYAFAMAPRAFADIAKDREIEEGWEPGKWSGIFIATRGMPTGIEIDPPATYNSGYWRRVLCSSKTTK